MAKSMKATNVEVKYKNGKTFFGVGVVTAAQCSQFLVAVQDEMCKVFGDYTWTLEQFRNEYIVMANYEGGSFTEGRGKTPALAMMDAWPVACTVRDLEFGKETTAS